MNEDAQNVAGDEALVPVSGRSRPTITPDTEFFWTAAAQQRLTVQECSACGELRYPPGPTCFSCHSLEWREKDLSGRGRVISYTVLHHPTAPGFTGPALVVLILLDEGIRMLSNLVDVPADAIEIDMPVEVCFLDQREGWTVPQFRRLTDR